MARSSRVPPTTIAATTPASSCRAVHSTVTKIFDSDKKVQPADVYATVLSPDSDILSPDVQSDYIERRVYGCYFLSTNKFMWNIECCDFECLEEMTRQARQRSGSMSREAHELNIDDMDEGFLLLLLLF